MSKMDLVAKLDSIEWKIKEGAEHFIDEVKDEAHELLSKVEALLTPPEAATPVAAAAPANDAVNTVTPEPDDTPAPAGDAPEQKAS